MIGTRLLRTLHAAIAAVTLLSLSGSARAEQDVASPPATGAQAEKPRPTISVRAAPVFGTEAATGDGWIEVAVSIDNVGGTTRKGNIELTSALPWGREQAFTTRAPFNVAPGRSVIVKMPTHGFAFQAPTLTLLVKDESGEKLAGMNITASGVSNPMIVDVDQPSRLAVVMRNWPIPVTWNPQGYGSYAGYGASKATLTVGVPTFDRSTGDPILPDHAAAYSAATVVLIHSDALARLDAVSLDALVSWVISGGTLAIVPTRPEDLRSATMTALTGGVVVTTPPPPVMMSLPAVDKPQPPGGLFPTDPLDNSPPPPDLDTPMKLDPQNERGGGENPFIPIRTVMPKWPKVGPTPDVRAKLEGYSGGNLVPSVFGASAPYGSGEVHLLAFDPTIAPMLDDPWVHSRVVDLITHAWDRRATHVVAQGGGERYMARFDEIRRALDPNENFRPALGVAAILLVLYSIMAGPVTFMRAAKRGKPLSPLKWVPIWSAAAFAAIVLVGLAGKGWKGRARHLAIVESGAGVSRGSIRRFRGFFTSETRALSIASTDSTSVMNVATTDSLVHDQSALRIDRNGSTLEDITSLPWQTIVVREEGFFDMKGGVSVLPTKDGTYDVVNHTGRELKNILISVPGVGIYWFETVKDGDKVHAIDGRLAIKHHARRVVTAGTLTVHPLAISAIGAGLTGKLGDEISHTWQPIESASGEVVDWWPDTIPVVLGEIVGGEKATRDSGLSVESDRVVFRIVGRGGAP
ncbi:MAG: uncharacterized protein JWM74_2931 [Myxococcaceae bacterium]|nr:uncharacterized protein [Myxococcaceae bacterium]